MKDQLKAAAALRAEASRDRKDGELMYALESILASVDILNRMWERRCSAIDEAGGAASPDDKELVKELAETYGVMGGIHRSRGEYTQAIDAYDQGAFFERHPASKRDNSYSLMQRLLNRALLEPQGADSPGWCVRNVLMAAELRDVVAILALQRSTTRLGDAWAVADQAMANALLVPLDPDSLGRRAEVDMALDALDEKGTPPFVFDSTLHAMRDAHREFSKAGESYPGARALADILEHSIARLEAGFEKALKRQSTV